MKISIFFPWLITNVVILLLLLSIISAHFYPYQHILDENERIFWRTTFYILTIFILPLTNLLRYIFLRLNQTMPLLENTNVESVVKLRYTLTVSISMLLMLIVGSFGATIFYFGDGVNSLHILTGVALLGVFLYRPKLIEYQQIIHALTENDDD